jgi:FkbM family methyltransferase
MISFVVNLLAKYGVFISRKPLEKHFPKFIEIIHSEILKNSDGILHIGAHTGQEAKCYWELGKPVMWFEAIPTIFEDLERNIRSYPNQKAFNFVLGDTQGSKISLNVSSNEGQSSSIFEFAETARPPGITMIKKLDLVMHRLDGVITWQDSKIHNHWVIDVQGAEYLVLQGSGELIKNCNSMFIEVSTMNYYEGGVRWEKLLEFLRINDFYPLWTPKDNFHGNVIFVRKFPASGK